MEREHFARLVSERKALLAAEEAQRKRREEEEETAKLEKISEVEKNESGQGDLPRVDGEEGKEAVGEASVAAPMETTEAATDDGPSGKTAVAEDGGAGQGEPEGVEKEGGEQDGTEAGK